MIITENTLIGKLKRLISRSVILQSILFSVFAFLVFLALWNQDVLTAERERYGANDIRPGLTGWAQINGRDELEIPAKAKLDGDYGTVLMAGGFKAFLFDCRCFIGTIFSVARSEGVVEGGTGEGRKQSELNHEEKR